MTSAHSHLPRAGRRHLRALAISFGLVLIVMVAEFVTGWITGSLALVSDAGHMATDALGLGMALAAIVAADRAASGGDRTYGMYRLEVLAALANAVLLFAVAGYVLFEAARRLQHPPDVLTGPMLVVALAGLVVNVIGWRMLRSGAEESINVRGAYLEVLADLAGSVGVIVAAIVMMLTGWAQADPIIASLIGLFILPRAWGLGRQALRVLVQAAPRHLDLEELRRSLNTIPEVTDVHDVHVWTLTSEMDVATVHLVTAEGIDPHPVLDRAEQILRDDYAIAHATLQVEPDTHHTCAEISW